MMKISAGRLSAGRPTYLECNVTRRERKMRPRRLILFCAVLAALPGSAVGQTEPASATGSVLFASCQAHEPRCGAYLQGVLDMMNGEIGRASGRERVCQYVSISVGDGAIKKKKPQHNTNQKTH